ncbi:MAG: nicotinate-nucleotide adenylyltransferase [Sinobacteraceae bacterium]|nr:nicotinate-nucleotide adenylyltransferase [Nevskiaceae bacterium]
MNASPIGIFGGTFDPIHFGHLRTGFELLHTLSLGEMRWIPAGNPGHRAAPLAAATLRLEMVRAATVDQPGFVVDDREIRRTGITYTVDTLGELRREFPQRPLCLILGMDAFIGFESWHRWREVLEYAHLVVAHRPGWQTPQTGTLASLLESRAAKEIDELHTTPAGLIRVQEVTQLEISSSDLRAIITSGRDPRFLVPDAVCEIIRRTQCYARP